MLGVNRLEERNNVGADEEEGEVGVGGEEGRGVGVEMVAGREEKGCFNLKSHVVQRFE